MQSHGDGPFFEKESDVHMCFHTQHTLFGAFFYIVKPHTAADRHRVYVSAAATEGSRVLRDAV